MMNDLFNRDRLGYLDTDHNQCVYYSQAVADKTDVQVRIVDTHDRPEVILLQPEQALKLLSWLEKERETLEALRSTL